MIKSILEWYMWPVYAVRFTKWSIAALLRAYDQNRLIYTFVIFPAHLIIFVAAFLLLFVTFAYIGKYHWLIAILIPQVIFIGFPAFATIHLSLFLVMKGYWDLLTGLMPGASFMAKIFDSLVELYRPTIHK